MVQLILGLEGLRDVFMLKGRGVCEPYKPS